MDEENKSILIKLAIFVVVFALIIIFADGFFFGILVAIALVMEVLSYLTGHSK